MKRFRDILPVLIAVSLAACNHTVTNNGANPKDTPTYSYKTFKQRDTSCGNNPDSSCTIVKITYPDFDGQTALNDSVKGTFIKLFALNPAKTDTGFGQLAANFISRYTDFKKKQPKSTLFYLLDGHAKVLKQDSDILTIEVSGYAYHGGAHGVDCTGYVNWGTKANKSIALDDLFVSGYEDSLNKIAEQIFKKNEKLRDTASLNNGRTYFFKDNKFSLPGNFLITADGIKFLYNVYTIKPYQAGKTYLLVPYDQIKSLLLPGAIVRRYMKD